MGFFTYIISSNSTDKKNIVKIQYLGTFFKSFISSLGKISNKGNYCIIFLIIDHLLGTYNSCIDNKEYCKNPHKSHIDFCNKEINKIKLENGFKWC